MPGCDRLLCVPLGEFYTSYAYFCEDTQGRRELGYFLDRIKTKDVFYDIGGFRGAYSAAAKAKAGTEIRVHIFEPLVKNVEAIQRVCKLNTFDNFKINPLAVSDGSVLAARVNEQDAMLRLGDINAAVAAEFPSTSLDEYIARGNPPPTVIKIDVDGYELHVLRGARKCLSEYHPRLWIEIHPEFLAVQKISTDAVLNLLRQSGYKILFYDDFNLPEAKMSYHVWCE